MFVQSRHPKSHPRLLPDGLVVDVVDGELRTVPATEAVLSLVGMQAAVGGAVELILSVPSRHRAGVTIGCFADEEGHLRGRPRNALIEIGIGGYLEVVGPMRWVALTRTRKNVVEWSALAPAEVRDIRVLRVPGARAPIVQLRGVSPAWPADATDPTDPTDEPPERG